MGKHKKLFISLGILVSSIVVIATVLIVLTCTLWKVDIKMTATQIGDSQKIKVAWEVSKDVKEIEITVSHKGRKINTTTLYQQNDIKKGSYVVDGFYGNMDVTLTAKRGLRENEQTKKVKLFTDEYNIAPLTATMAVTMLSLNLDEITQGGEIPTFVWFKRSAVWDYSQMPENVYTIPNATAHQVKTNSSRDLMYSKTSEWVKELYDLNPNSHFNFYYNDYWAYGFMQATIANGIPEDNYDLTLLSDGSASLTIFNNHFTSNDEQYATKYAEMKAEYETLKNEIAEKGYYKENDDSFEISAEELRNYSYIMAKEEDNVRWWLSATRNAIYDINNVDEGTTKKKTEVKELESQGKIVCKSLSTSFKALSAEQQENLKKLYNFGDDIFEEAQEQNKKAMIILGTWQTNEADFEEYVLATMAYYGHDDYIYYYKGHPRNPTPTVSGKMQYLNSLGLTDVDSTIAAELLFFYYPELLLCTGYDSSTYESLVDEQSGSIWNFSGGKQAFTTASKSYINNIDACFTVADSTNSQYGLHVNQENKTILIEEIDSKDIYLYDSVTKILKHLIFNEQTSQYDLAD